MVNDNTLHKYWFVIKLIIYKNYALVLFLYIINLLLFHLHFGTIMIYYTSIISMIT